MWRKESYQTDAKKDRLILLLKAHAAATHGHERSAFAQKAKELEGSGWTAWRLFSMAIQAKEGIRHGNETVKGHFGN